MEFEAFSIVEAIDEVDTYGRRVQLRSGAGFAEETKLQCVK